MNMADSKSFLGTGWSFPPTFERQEGRVETVSGVEDIRQSLTILFDTALGERVLQPKYGASLQDYVFEPVSTTLIHFIHDLLRAAIIYHEPRINLEDVSIDTSRAHEGMLQIEVEFIVRSTNSRFNFVYPFYLEEGTDISTIT